MNTINPELLELLERYIAHELPEQERIVFEVKLKEDKEIAETLDFFMAFEAEKENFGRFLMKQELQKVDLEMEQEKVYQPITSITEEVLQRIANFTHQTIEEVSGWFQPIPEYHALRLATERSDVLQAKTPTLGKDYTNETLIFEMEEIGDYLITIENNQREIVHKKHLQQGEKTASIYVTGYSMGIYYWKVMQLSKDSMLMGHFLVTIR